MPALLMVLAAYAVAAPIVFPDYDQDRWPDIAFAAFYLMDYAPYHPRPIGHTWSLAIEEQFYVVWPFVIWGLSKLSRGVAVRLLLLLWAAITLGRIATLISVHDWPQAYLPLHVHSSGLVLGALTRFLPKPPPLAGWLGSAGLVCLVGLGPVSWQGSIVWGITAAEVSTAALITGMGPMLKSVLAWRPLSALGLISYGVYLWHFPISQAIDAPWPIKFAVTFGLSVVMAMVSFLTLERWAQRFRGAKISDAAMATS